ncbi:MAG: hypothetical protein IPM70_13125 [Proteobacteria bacterium]|nr:hypothetical protein [Pseudomonadota bacterium]
MSAGEARILTTHVGSLVRPPGFAMQLRERQAGRLADADYEKALRSAVQQVVQEQVEAGVDVVSDGEYGKMLGWEQYALERMEGFGPRQELQMHTGGSAMFSDMQQFPDFYEEYWKHQELSEGIYPCIGPIRYTGHNALQRDIETLKEAMKRAGAKHGFLPVAAPASAFALSPNAYYKTDEEYVLRAQRHCARSTWPSSTPGCTSRLTMHTCRSCTTGSFLLEQTKTSGDGRKSGSTH